MAVRKLSSNCFVQATNPYSDFLLFVPAHDPTLRQVFSYFTTTMSITQEGDVVVSNDTVQGLGKYTCFHPSTAPPLEEPKGTVQRPYDHQAEQSNALPDDSTAEPKIQDSSGSKTNESESSVQYNQPGASDAKSRPLLTAFLPNSGYFMAGAIAGIVSRTSTAPLDRLKVYLIAQTDTKSAAVEAAKQGSPLTASRHALRPLMDAMKELWKAGGMRSLFAGEQSLWRCAV